MKCTRNRNAEKNRPAAFVLLMWALLQNLHNRPVRHHSHRLRREHGLCRIFWSHPMQTRTPSPPPLDVVPSKPMWRPFSLFSFCCHCFQVIKPACFLRSAESVVLCFPETTDTQEHAWCKKSRSDWLRRRFHVLVRVTFRGIRNNDDIIPSLSRIGLKWPRA